MTLYIVLLVTSVLLMGAVSGLAAVIFLYSFAITAGLKFKF